MKLSKLFNSTKKRILAGAILALAIFVPVSQSLAAAVTIEGNMGVANKTAGDTTYSSSVNASYNDVVKIEVYYHNRELPDSGKIAQNVRMKIDIPSTPGIHQTQTATISGDNTNTVTKTTSVTLNRSDAYLQYLPGSAVWRHNIGTNDSPNWVDTVISDNVVMGGSGLVLENEQPCYNFSATVTVLARVMVPGVSVTKQVRVKGTTAWSTSITAKAGDTVQYLISYKNTGNTDQNSVVVADKLPQGVTYVNGTTYLANDSAPNGKQVADGVTVGGITIGNYNPGVNAFVIFNATLPSEASLSCGSNLLRNIATVQPAGMNYYYNTADVTINKTCTPPPKTPVYSCDLLTLTTGDNRTVTANVQYTAQNGASFKVATYNWGDSSTPFVTNKTSANHQYSADGTYTVSAKLLFNVNGTDKYAADNANCVKTVTFTTPNTPPQTPPTPPVLPNTGAGSVIGIFGVVSVLGAIGYRLFLGRKFAR